jgi:hypothetical protein
MVVEEFWRLMASNDFQSVKAVLSHDFVLEWPQTSERIRGADNFALMNAAYPSNGTWSFELNRIVVSNGEAVTDTNVTDGEMSARAISFFNVECGLVTKIVEFWPEPYDPPFDRSEYVERLE